MSEILVLFLAALHCLDTHLLKNVHQQSHGRIKANFSSKCKQTPRTLWHGSDPGSSAGKEEAVGRQRGPEGPGARAEGD